MKKTAVINVVGLTQDLIGEHTPFLAKWATEAKSAYIKPVLPAITCPVQSSYLTGKWPTEHGIVANGWYFHEFCEVKSWHQSNKLVTAPKIWDEAKRIDPSFTCAKFFWWYDMYGNFDVSITPRPIYTADGRKLENCYTTPPDLRHELQAELGNFPLYKFWGPRASIHSSRWIADASMIAEKKYPSTLTLIYLPHLDYGLQRLGPHHPDMAKELRDIDAVCADLIRFYEKEGAQVIVLSEYGINEVKRGIPINRVLRQHGYIQVRDEEHGREILDAGASKAFAVADHQIAHIYVNDKSKLSAVRSLIEKIPGVQEVLGEEEKKIHHLDHPRAGDLVAVSEADSWFAYYYWLDDKKAPDFSHIVEVFKKPGYDPLELVSDPKIKFPNLKLFSKLLKLKLGFRCLFDFIPFDTTLVKGSHGRYPDDPKQGPLVISKQKHLIPDHTIEAIDVYSLMMNHLKN